MGKTAFLFPGQGAQKVGMAREFYDNFSESREVFKRAGEAAGFSLEELCFSENDKINQTRYTQPALLCASLAILAAVRKAGICADMAAGLSLGEYCALTAAGAFLLPEAVEIVCRRGAFMEEAVPEGQGKMMAILSRKPLPAEEICREICRETGGIVCVANYNCPGQQVISGEKEAVDLAAKKLLEAGAARAVPLSVSGPFHSPMLSGAGEQLAELLKTREILSPSLTFFSNVTAQAVDDPEEIRTLLSRQVCSPVRWQQSMEAMIAAGADTFLEIGPGTTLSNFAKKIDRSVRVHHIEKPEDLEAV